MTAFADQTLARWSALLLSMLVAFEPAAYAQYTQPATSPPENVPLQAQPAFSQRELDQMLAPIALYPDPLLSQILMASTYPLEVVEAARWSRANPGLLGDDAVRAVQQQDWDPSVKSLVAFPQILQMMDERLEWTERMGDAFLAQEAQVMATVQNLRQKAYAAGNLRSNEQIRVEPQGQTIVVVPANPDIIYVPYYDPFVVYGSWWWPDYPPVYWAPWPGYYYAPGYAPGFAWGIGIAITTGFFFGAFDWPHHRVHVVNPNNYYYSGRVHRERPGRPGVTAAPGVWQHDPDHRRGVPYRELSVRQQFGRERPSPEFRRNYRGYDQFPSGARGGLGGIPAPSAARPGAVETRPPVSGDRMNRPYERSPQIRPGTPNVISRPPREARPPALEDIGRGANVRDYSTRGRASQEGIIHRQSSPPARRPSGSAPPGRTRHPR